MLKVGGLLDGRRVLKISVYRGKYPQWFDAVVTVTSPFTKSGQIEYAYKYGDGKEE